MWGNSNGTNVKKTKYEGVQFTRFVSSRACLYGLTRGKLETQAGPNQVSKDSKGQ